MEYFPVGRSNPINSEPPMRLPCSAKSRYHTHRAYGNAKRWNIGLWEKFLARHPHPRGGASVSLVKKCLVKNLKNLIFELFRKISFFNFPKICIFQKERKHFVNHTAFATGPCQDQLVSPNGKLSCTRFALLSCSKFMSKQSSWSKLNLGEPQYNSRLS